MTIDKETSQQDTGSSVVDEFKAIPLLDRVHMILNSSSEPIDRDLLFKFSFVNYDELDEEVRDAVESILSDSVVENPPEHLNSSLPEGEVLFKGSGEPSDLAKKVIVEILMEDLI